MPKNLRPLLKGQRQIYKSTQTNDYEEARDKLRDLEAELYLKLDHAELANHPLSKTYDALWEGLDGLGFWQETYESNKQKALIEKWAKENPFSYMMLFENEHRWELYDEIRNMAGYVMATPSPGMSDPEESIVIATVQDEIEPLLQDFDLEFRKVSEVKYAPKNAANHFLMPPQNGLIPLYFKIIKKLTSKVSASTRLPYNYVFHFFHIGLFL